jgi:hypothetical protein
MAAKQNRQNWFKLEAWVWLPLLAIFCLLVWCRQINLGGFSWSDASIHAMDGVFILDIVRDLPTRLHDWAEQYYLRYPCLGIVTFYPPFFAGVEAIFYAIFGVSVLTARLCVVAFALTGFFAMYWIGKQLLDKTAGLLAAGLWATLPMTVLWSRQVMLEVPTVTMLLLCFGCYLKYRASKTLPWIIATAIFFTFAFFTKQWAIFLGAVILIDLLRSEGLKKTFTPRHMFTAGLCLLVIGAYMTFSSRYAALSPTLVRGEQPWRHLLSTDHWLFYLRTLPQVVSWPIVGFAGLGILLAASAHQLKTLRLPILWSIAFYIFATIIAYKEPRYFYLIAPAAVLLAVGGITKGLEKTHLAWAGRGLLLTLLLIQFIHGWFQNPDRLSDFAPAAKAIIERGDTDLILVDANRDGQFVFDMRKLQGPDGKIITLRGSKLLYSRAARSRWNYQAHVETEADILKLIRDYGIRYVVVESAPPNVPDWRDFFPPPSQQLRMLLRDESHFEKLLSFPVSPAPTWHAVDIELYRYRRPFGEVKKSITFPMPSVGQDLELPIPTR